jgi:hypothetical protein
VTLSITMLASPFWVMKKGVPFAAKSSEICAAWLFRYEMDLMLAADGMVSLLRCKV